jgi:hypothetical protein
MQGLFILAFFLGLFYRSATLYHPQGSRHHPPPPLLPGSIVL